MYAQPITREQYEWLIKDREWARRHAPGLPEANLLQPVDTKRFTRPQNQPGEPWMRRYEVRNQ
jgi:hypothetical protein